MQTLIGSLDLTGADYQIESYDFGVPRLKSDAAMWDVDHAPLAYPGDRHEDADFELTVTVRGGSAATVEANLSALLAAFVPNAVLRHTEGEATGSRYTYVRSVTDPRIIEHVGGWLSVTIRGTRCPYWHGAQVEVTEASVANNFGTVDVENVPGDVCALTRYYLSGPSGTTGLTLSVRPKDTGFTWSQDESGTSDATMLGGAKKNTTLSADYAAVSSVRTLTTASYAGRFLIAARVSCGAGTKVRANVSGVYSQMSVCVGGGVETVLVGPVVLPPKGYTRDFPSTTVSLEAKGTGSFSLDAWYLVPISGVDKAASIVHLDSTMCLDGIPLVAPNVYSWTRASDTIGLSTLDKATPYGWPMLRPDDNTLYVSFAAPTLGTGYVSASYIPRYLLPA